MSSSLTRSAKKSLAALYREYRQRISNGEEKSVAAKFTEYSKEIHADRLELRKAGFVDIDLLGNLALTNRAIIYMESLTVDTIKEWLSFGAQFIP